MTDEQKEIQENKKHPNNENDFLFDEQHFALLKSQQNFLYATIGGLLVTLISAFVWAFLSVL